jgi:hypothetical protein
MPCSALIKARSQLTAAGEKLCRRYGIPPSCGVVALSACVPSALHLPQRLPSLSPLTVFSVSLAFGCPLLPSLPTLTWSWVSTLRVVCSADNSTVHQLPSVSLGLVCPFLQSQPTPQPYPVFQHTQCLLVHRLWMEDHPSFADEAYWPSANNWGGQTYSAPPKGWKGTCQADTDGTPFPCK